MNLFRVRLAALAAFFLFTFASQAFTVEPETVNLRLFASYSVKEVLIRGIGTWRLNGHGSTGPIRLTVLKGQVNLTDLRGHQHTYDRVELDVESGLLVLELPKGASRQTDGHIEIDVWGGQLRIINRLEIESYIAGIAPAEMASVPITKNSLMAQMVASRSYVLTMHHRHGKAYDFCDTAHCQAFNGLQAIDPRVIDAAIKSRGEYLAYRGKAIPAFYHDTCGGSTASANDVWNLRRVPYLRGHPDGVGLGNCRNSPHAHWSVRLNRETVRFIARRKRWISAYQALDTLKVIRTDRFGRARQVLVQTDRPRWVPAPDFRNAINQHFGSEVMPSSQFVIIPEGNAFRVVGRGWGHGVGLCQWGAAQMAREGRSYRQILAYYFPGTKIQRMPEALARPVSPEIVVLAKNLTLLGTKASAFPARDLSRKSKPDPSQVPPKSTAARPG